jgi:aarF domain-containing kinase
MASSGASWFRVAAGIRLVAQAGASMATTEVARQGHLALGHAMQIVQSAAQKQQQQQPEGYEEQHRYQQPWNVPTSMTPSSFSETSASTIVGAIRQSGTERFRTETLENVTANANATATLTAPTSRTSSATAASSATTRDNSATATSAIASSTATINMDETSALATASTSQSSPQQQIQHQQRSSQHQHEEDVVNLLEEGRAVPSTRVGRAFGFAQLGLGLAMGTAREGLSRLLISDNAGSSSSNGGGSSSIAMNDANADRLAASLCRMRGAALKMGQMLSIQDESLLPSALTRALSQVRQGAEAMPARQVKSQLSRELGADWRDLFVEFEDRPFAAASVGQVHRAKILAKNEHVNSSQQNNDNDNSGVRDVVVKVQYPGVADSIESDLRNLGMLVQWSGLSPPGLFLENVIRVGSKEMKVECNYLQEMHHQRHIRDLVHADDFLHVQNKFVVPDVVPDLTTRSIITSEYVKGGTIDKAANLNQEERNRIGRAIMYLTMQELFVWRFMQTDPNWGNFLYNVGTGTIGLIDFGASREYSKDFVDGYLRIVWASANRDEETLMKQSHRMNFLTGRENEQMLEAHKLSGFTVGEPFYRSNDYVSSNTASNQSDVPLFDFRGSNISSRMGAHTAVFMQHRLTAPPEEVYTLHRKLAGAYMLCIKLGAVIPCRDLLARIVENYKFDDGQPHPMADLSLLTNYRR